MGYGKGSHAPRDRIVSVSRMRTVPLVSPVMRTRPSTVQLRLVTVPVSRTMFVSPVDLKSHTRTVLSSPAETTRNPPRETASPRTAPLCPPKLRMGSPVCKFHSLRVPSIEHDRAAHPREREIGSPSWL